MEEATIVQVDARAYKVGVPLYYAYLEENSPVHSSFEKEPGEGEILKKAARMAIQRQVPHKKVAEVMESLRYQIGGGSLGQKEIQKIAEGAPVVLTGQQPGLFGGPAYTLYKILHAKALSVHLEEELKVPVACVFWCGSEDADLLEANHTYLFRRTEPPLKLEYPISPEDEGRAMADWVFQAPHLSPLVELFLLTLPESEEKKKVKEWISRSYLPPVTSAMSFLRLMTSFLESFGIGVAFIDSSLPELRALEKPFFTEEIRNPGRITEKVLEAGRNLRSLGFSPAIQKKPHQLNFFLRQDGKRKPVLYQDGQFIAGEKAYGEAELLTLLEGEPERFSTGVVLRPVAQDFLFRTLAYVAGPSEVAYQAQLKPVYQAFGVPQPVILPRTTWTVLTNRFYRLLTKYHLSVEDMSLNISEVLSKAYQHSIPPLIVREWKSLEEDVLHHFEVLDELSDGMDPALRKPLDALRKRLHLEFQEFYRKMRQSARKKHTEIDRQIRKLKEWIFPRGKSQERILNPFYLYCLLGERFVQEILKHSLDNPRKHHILIL